MPTVEGPVPALLRERRAGTITPPSSFPLPLSLFFRLLAFGFHFRAFAFHFLFHFLFHLLLLNRGVLFLGGVRRGCGCGRRGQGSIKLP